MSRTAPTTFHSREQRHKEFVLSLAGPASDGDVFARTVLYRESDPEERLALLDTWGIEPSALCFDCLGEVIFA